MSISNKLKTILSLQSIAVNVKSIYKNVQKVFDAGKNEDQWIAYCLKTGEHFDLPEGMTEIPVYMFNGHSNLETVQIPITVKKINDNAFEGTTNLKVGQLPEGVIDKALVGLEEIGVSAFAYSGSDVVIFPSGIVSVGAGAFTGNSNLKEVYFVKTNENSGIPSGGLPSDTFAECENLEAIYVPWSDGAVPGAPWGAPATATITYNYWDNIPDVFHFPQGFVKVPDHLFYTTTATTAKEIYLWDECKEIGECSFYKAKNLTTVHLPDGLKKIAAYAFRYCSALKLSELPDSVEEIGKYAFHGSSVSLSKLPKNIKKIATNAFQNCPNNTFAEIPESITLIASGAFLNNTGLTKLYFVDTPTVKKVTNGIANNAFEGCTNLVEIAVPWSEGQVSGAPWGAENATIIYDWRSDQ